MTLRHNAFWRIVCAFSLLVAVQLAANWQPAHAGELTYTGVNLSTAEFGAQTLPGTYNTNYTYPTSQEVDYYVNKGMNTFRLPFRWERMQTTPNGPLDTTQLSRMDSFVNYATSKGAYVLIDPHNFERYYPSASNFQQSSQGLIGGSVKDVQSSYNTLNGGSGSGSGNGVGDVVVTNAMFADFWGKMANHYANNSHVIFDLMNEPANVAASTVAASDNAAIAAIRANGATSQLILVEGSSYTGAWTWTSNQGSSGNNSTAFAPANIVDPNNNWAVEMHQYMDSDGSGSHDTINNNDASTGVSRITAATNWLLANHVRGFLGEFAVSMNSIGNSTYTSASDGQSHPQIGDETVKNMLNYMEQNSSAWLGWAWWGGGPSVWWNSGTYMFGLDPNNLNNPVDKAAMGVLSQFLPTAGDFDRDGHVTAADVSAMMAALADINAWNAAQTALGLTPTQEKIIADVNKDGVINNADLQKLLLILQTGGGSETVPEPSSMVLLALAGVIGCYPASRLRRARKAA